MLPTIIARVNTRINSALTLRGTCRRCNASTGLDSTNANSSASAMGTNATCATYSNNPNAPQTMSFPAVTGLPVDSGGLTNQRPKTTFWRLLSAAADR